MVCFNNINQQIDCPKGKVGVTLTCIYSNGDSYKLLASDGSIVGAETLPSEGFKKSYCLTPGDYTMKMTLYADSDSALVNPLVLTEESGVILETFSKSDLESLAERHIQIGDILPYGSTLKYTSTYSVPDNWMNVGFDDQSWKEGQAGSWSIAGNEPIYFRKEVTIDNPSQFSHFFIEMSLAKQADLYLNGKQLRSFTPSSSDVVKTVVYGQANQLTKKNVIGVKTEGLSPLSFDIRLHLMTSQCFSSAFTGKATSDQPLKDPRNKPDYAFLNYGYWTAYPFPVNLMYVLDNDMFIAPTAVTMSSYYQTERVPKEVKVFGRVVDHSRNDTVVTEEEIGYVNDPLFFERIDMDSIPLSPKRAYNSFRFQFIRGSNTTAPLNDIFFTICQQGTCKKEKKVPETSLGGIVYSRCSFGSYGYSQKICSRENAVPVWKEDESMCLSKWPRSSSAFIDVEFLMANPIKTAFDRVTYAAKLQLKNNLPVWDGQIAFPINYQYTEDGITYLRVVLRLSVEEEAGDYVYKKLTDFYDEFKEYMTKETSYYYSSLTLSEEPKLYTPLEWGNILAFVIVFAVGMILGIFGSYMYLRSKGILSNRKSLKKNDGENLLAQAEVYVVCWK